LSGFSASLPRSSRSLGSVFGNSMSAGIFSFIARSATRTISSTL
jgi:hypothetical protein